MKTLSSILAPEQLQCVGTLSPAEINLILLSGNSEGVVVLACSEMTVDDRFPPTNQPFYIFQNLGGLAEDSIGLDMILTEKKIEHLVVFGHSRCGVIETTLGNGHSANLSRSAFTHIFHRTEATRQAAREQFGDKFDREVQKKATKDLLLRQLASILKIDSVMRRSQSGRLRVHCWILDSETLDVESFDPTRLEFFPLPHLWR